MPQRHVACNKSQGHRICDCKADSSDLSRFLLFLAVAIWCEVHADACRGVFLRVADPKQLGGSGSIEGFDYPSLVQTPDGYLHIAYTCTTHGAVSNFVKYIVIDEAYVLEGSKFAAHTGLYRGEVFF